MTDVAAGQLIDHALVQAPKRAAVSHDHGRTRAAILCLGFAIVLTVPSSEIRAKAFRIGLIARTASVHIRH